MIALAALLLAAAPGESVADAERAFAHAAEADGQWTAFRATADRQALMYAPGPVNAQAFLAGRVDPPTHLSWRPAHTITSCDGTLAYSTGPWTVGGKSGSFGTIWRHGAQGWRWLYDNGHEGGAGFASGPVIADEAACGTLPGGTSEKSSIATVPQTVASLRGGALAGLIEASDGAMPGTLTLGAASAEGSSSDRTLRWRIDPIAGGKAGAHLLRLWSWDGRRYRLAVLDYSDGS